MNKNHKKIVALEGGYYTSVNEDNEYVIVVRGNKGFGYSIKTKNSKGIYECVDYDENGIRECEYVERL